MSYYSYPYSCLTFGLFAPEHIRRKGSLSVDRAILIFIKPTTTCYVRTMVDNNTWFKVQNVSHVSPRENRIHAGWRASIYRAQSGDKRLADFRCGELAKVASVYKKASRKRRQAAKATRNESIKRKREEMWMLKKRVVYSEIWICLSLFLILYIIVSCKIFLL